MEEILAKIDELQSLIQTHIGEGNEKTNDLYCTLKKLKKDFNAHIEDEAQSIDRLSKEQKDQHDIVESHIITSIDSFKHLASNIEMLNEALSDAIKSHRRRIGMVCITILVIGVGTLFSLFKG